MFIIKHLKAREILDSRGNPTLEVDLVLDKGGFGRFSVPSGASVGLNEALELRDYGQRYLGLGVKKAVDNVNYKIAESLIGKAISDQNDLDNFLINLDNTPNKSKLGANTTLAVSMAFAKAVANLNNQPFFKSILEIFGKHSNSNLKDNMDNLGLMVNILNGGKHADNRLDIQEFMIVIGNEVANINERIRIASEVFHHLAKELGRCGFSTNVGDEGGFAPNINSTRAALDLICLAIDKSGYNEHVKLALDAAASTFYSKGKYHLNGEGMSLSNSQLIDYYTSLVSDYPIISIEDSFAEDDIEGWSEITKKLGHRIKIVGDDLFVTNTKLLSKGIKQSLANSILIKPNQVGTLSETISAIKLAHDNSYTTIISHRSGETEDTSIAHLAIASGSSYIKAGSMCRTDRVSKYNELIRIAELIYE